MLFERVQVHGVIAHRPQACDFAPIPIFGHTLQLPDQNATKDRIINQLSLAEERIVISKDSDFFYSHLLQGRPWKLLLVKTGNISMRDLCALFERNLPTIETALERHTLVEIDRAAVTPVM